VRHQFLSQGHHGNYRAAYRNERSDRRNGTTGHVILPVVHLGQPLHLSDLLRNVWAPKSLQRAAAP
jgi:hypothetical protein